MVTASKKNPFLNGFLVGLATGLALSIVVALLVTRNNAFVEGNPAQDAAGVSSAKPDEAPKYEFQQPPALEEQAPTTPAAPAPAVTSYYLQAGAYGNAAEAEQVKARLALLGFEAKIISAQEGDATLHKPRVGPYKSLDELNVARTRLTQNGINTILVKISPEEKP